MECEREVVDQIQTFLEKPATIDIAFARLLYMACRLLAPDHVVETGVWYGVSSAVVLAALKKNSNGSLISIDFPPLDPSARVEIGSAVSPELRQRWQLHIGPSSQLLPKLLKGFGQIQMFIHDSEHSYRNMLTEYSYAWEYLSPGGILISDDVHKSDAFLEFAWKVNHKPRVITKTPKGGYIGILVK
jgi:predicted O-methyltransferase YrrM